MKNIYRSLLIAFMIFLIGCSGGSTGTETVTKQINLAVVSTTPLNAASDTARDGDITVIFNGDLDVNTVNATTFNIKDDQNNIVAAESITVNGMRAAYKPKIKLWAARKYTVVISSAIKGINYGAMTDDYTFDFTTQNSQWSNPEIFSQATYAKTAVDNNGNAIIVWWRYNNSNGHYEIVMSQLKSGTWSDPSVISGNATSVYSPSVAMDNNGNAIIIWNDWGDWVNTGGIVMTEYRNGVWSEPRFINTTVFMSIFPPTVAMNDNGNALIVWSQNDIYKTEYISGSWSASVSVSSGGNAEYPEVVMNRKGNYIITWLYNDHYATHEKIYSTVSQGGIWSEPTIISVVGNDPDMLYQIAFDNNDHAIVVWEQRDGTSLQAFRNEYINGNWIGAVSVSTLGTQILSPKVAMDNNGNAIIAWQQSVNNISQVFISELKNGIWNTPTQVGTLGTFAANPLIKMDSSGNAIILWNQADGTDWQVFRSQLINGVWTGQYLVAVSHNQLNKVQYDLAMDGSGDADMVWSQYDGSNWLLYRSQYH